MTTSVSPPRSPSAVVRLEVRVGSGRPTLYEVGDGGFLVGSVPGCDLRLPGTNLAPVIALIARQSTGASLRKLAPVQPIVVNSKAVTAAYLNDGDIITVGVAEILVAIEVSDPPSQQEPAPVVGPALPPEVIARVHQIEEREKELFAQARHMEADRLLWQRQQKEDEAALRAQTQQLHQLTGQLRQQESQLSAARAEFERREEMVRGGNEVFIKKEQELDARTEEVIRQEAEVSALRKELNSLRTDLAQRYQQRREKLVTQQEGIRKAARTVQARKKEIDLEQARLETLKQEWALQQTEIEARGEQVEREKQMVEEQHRLLASRQQENQREAAKRLEDIQTREQKIIEERAALEKGQKQHQGDLVRLDRIQASIEQRQKQLEHRALEIDKKFEQLQRDSRDMEEQANQLDEWHNSLTSETERLAEQKKEYDGVISQLDQRASALEGQQAMLVTLRSRLERMREELRVQEQALSDQRVLQEAGEADLKDRLAEAERIRSEVRNDKIFFEEERRRFEDRRATLDQAVTQLRQARESLDAEQKELAARREQVEATAAEQEEQAGAILARGQQIEEMMERLQADRQTLRDREATLTRAEQTIATLQEQLRKRSEELNARQKALEQAERDLEQLTAEHKVRLAQTEQAQTQAGAELERLRVELADQMNELERRTQDLADREQGIQTELLRMEEARQSMTTQRQGLATERIAWEVEKQAAVEKLRQGREDFTKAREETQMLARQLPELELRATAAVERLVRAREQLREHLAEVHAYAKQSREDLETARKHVHVEVERVRQQELDLDVARDEHRLAVAGFRQQLIEWQGKVGEMKQVLQLGSSQLEIRQAAVEEQARQVADTSAKLAAEVVKVETEKRQVAQQRGEMDRHLGDMREWYRKKVRELAGVDAPPGEPGEGDVVPMPQTSAGEGEPSGDRDPTRAVLTLNDEIAPADRQLGELLVSLDLVDTDSLQALWAEARRQRRSLRQLLLAGGDLTLYQMALIEAGALDALVLGPVRVIDKLPSTPREAVYRVYDPRRKCEAMLRHLAESEMEDAVRPDEFRQRFAGAAVVRQSQVAEVLEVLEIAGRPAVLLEWVHGISGADLPGLAAAPGAWYRLVCQAAAGLHAAHSAGLCHGHLEASSFVLTGAGSGTLKLLGLGEPRWLSATEGEESVAGDLFALGQIAAAWAALPPGGKGGKSKPLPDELRAIVTHLTSEDADNRFPTALAVLEELERAGATVPASTTAWTRLLEKVREQVPASARSA